ncbi:MAG TPA: 50S ribosomal protein L22 [Acidobacteriota bacterium]|nr:50S ribosomal protein L22 [Acidobacteriota bacterium]
MEAEQVEIKEVSKAKGKYFKVSPQKARLVVDLIRGKDVTKALGILKVTSKRACRPVEKVLKSAIANAKEKQPTIDVDNLYVHRAYVDSGPTKMWKRIRPTSMLKVMRIVRRHSHISIHLAERR